MAIEPDHFRDRRQPKPLPANFATRLELTLLFALLAMCLASTAGLPLWRSWPIGDQADFGVLVAALTWRITGQMGRRIK